MLKVLVIASFLTGGCALTGFNSTHGPAFVTTYKDDGGLGYPAKQTKKRGEACSYNAFGIVAVGDGSIQSAKARGGITVVSHYDKRILNVLGFFGKACTIVYGN